MTKAKHPLNGTSAMAKLACAIGCVVIPLSGSAQEAAPLSTPVPETASQGEWLQWGPFTARPYVGGTVMYDNNIDLNRTNRVDDVIFHITPGIALHAGDTASRQDRSMLLEYSPDFVLFTQHSGGRNAVDHRAHLSVLWPISRLTLGLDQDYVAVTEPSVDVGERVQRRFANTRLTSRYELSDKTSVDVNGRFINRDYDDARFIESMEFINDNWFNYHVTPKLSTAVGVAFGWVDIEDHPDQNYQRGLVRATYSLTEKLEWNATAGGEWRHFDSDQSDRLSPIFGLGAVYRPTERTTFGLQAKREENNSAVVVNQNYIATSVTGSFRQEIQPELFAVLAGGYVNADYRAAARGVDARREDNYFFVRPSIDATLGEHWKTSIFIQYRENESTQRRVEFDNFQAGAQVSYTF